MLMASTRKLNYGIAADTGIYTRNRQMVYKYNIQHKTETKKVSQKAIYALMFLVVILLFSSWFGMIFFKSVISGVQMEINSVNKEIRNIEQQNSMLQAEKINAVDIESIKMAAEGMDMSLPGTYQVEYVDTIQDVANLKIID